MRAIKRLPGAKWDSEQRGWTVAPRQLADVTQIFPDGKVQVYRGAHCTHQYYTHLHCTHQHPPALHSPALTCTAITSTTLTSTHQHPPALHSLAAAVLRLGLGS